MTPPIYFCQMTQNRLSESKHCIEKYLPYVDKIILIDNGSIDDSIFYFRNWAQQEPKLEFYIVPWCDNFSKQRNEYLSRVPDNTYCLISDPDEVFEQSTLEALPELIKYAEAHNKDMIGFQCRSVTMKGPQKVWENLDNYWKRLLFKKYKDTHYVGNPHESLANHPHQIMDTKFIYSHIKQENVIWHRGARNAFTGGAGANSGTKNQHWVKLRTICNELNILNWHDFDKYLIKGNIDSRIKDEFKKYLTLTELYPGVTDGLSEMREFYKLYFRIYHNEEEPIELRDKYIP